MTRHVVARLPRDTGVSGWEAISTRHFPVRVLDQDVTADWLIIGAGFAGLSAARRLTQLRPGERIVILDASEVAKGPSGRNSGFMIDVPHNLSSSEYSVSDAKGAVREIAQNRFAIGFAADAAKEYGMTPSIFDQCGKINAAASERGVCHNEKYACSLKEIDESYRIIDREEMRRITGSDYYLSGLFTPGAAIIQPADYIRHFASGLLDKVELFEDSPVIELENERGLWCARTPRGSVSAPKVILGVNGHVQNFGHFRGRLLHIFTYASMTEAFAADRFQSNATGVDDWALLPADPMGATIRKITTNGLSRIVVRTRFTYDPSMMVSEQRVASIAQQQRRSLDARFPELDNVGMEYRWAGRLCLSRNSVPAFGEIEKGLFSACCENGLGTVKSTLAGIMAADLATDTPSPQLDDFTNQKPPSWVPPQPFAWVGVNAVIRWHERKAGREM